MSLSTCPVPVVDTSHVLLAHGGGGTLMQSLIEGLFRPAFGETTGGHDAAIIELNGERVAMTTDSFVVDPLFFPGGDIGSLSVHGTINDLATVGASPVALSAGFILTEGLDLEILRRVTRSMAAAAARVGVPILTGDTKVVERRKGDGLYINTTGLGLILHDQEIHPRSVSPGDVVLLSGDIGRHGVAIMAAREGLELETAIQSDSAPIDEAVRAVLASGATVHCIRDITRGGLAAVLNEVARQAGVGIRIGERQLPVLDAVRGVCELLGLDAMSVACEGRFVMFLPPEHADGVLETLSNIAGDAQPVVIGTVVDKSQTLGHECLVTMETTIGTERIIDTPTGELLPRIC